MIKKTPPPAQPPIPSPVAPVSPPAIAPRSQPRLPRTVKLFLNIGSYGIFWIWNLCFLLLLYGFVLPTFGRDLALAVANGEVAPEMLLTLVGLMLVPTGSAITGVWPLRRSPGRLMQLFFGVEAPLMLLLSLRVWMLRELTDASYFLIGTFLLSIFAFALSLWRPEWSQTRRWLGWLQGAVQSLMIIVGFYVAVLLALYTMPTVPGLLWEMGDYLLSGDWLRTWGDNLWQKGYHSALELLVIVLGFATLTFGFALPVIFGWFYSRTGLQGYLHLVRRQGRGIALIVVLSTLMAWFVVFGGVNLQPQLAAFARVAAANTPAGRAALVNNEPSVRRGLLNAYLYSYRYLGADGQKLNLQRLYRRALGWEGDRIAPLQYLHDWLLSPFLYQGQGTDADRAATAYAEIFDAPIQKAEQKAILKAMKSTVMLDAANAGVLDIGRRKVWVARQELNVEPHADYVDVELYEVYQNQTHEVEEIFYGFALPPNAVLTGIWLGETDNLSDRFPFQVAPRGAAQRVYNSQVQRQRPIDPALLEQVGPNQYRLRAFPIPVKLNHWERGRETVERPTEMHLWLTYRAIPQAGESLLPSLTEARNVFWTKQTQRLRNGATVQGFEDWFEDTQDAFAPTEQLSPIAVGGYTLTAQALDPELQPDLSGQEIALIVDTSYSMGQHRQDLQAQLDWLQAQGLLDGDRRNGEVTLYTLAAGETKPQRIKQTNGFSAKDLLFYGVVHLQDMVRSGESLGGSDYDALILLSDEGSYELVPDEEIALGDPQDERPNNIAPSTESETPSESLTIARAPSPKPSLPIWTVHLGALPAAYDDDTLKAIQDSQGNVTRSVAEALRQWRQQAQLTGNEMLTGSWRWQISANPDAIPTATGLEPIAARVLINYLAQDLDTNDVQALDALHGIATEQAIVTPYSSMIVLVNDEQRELLKQAEASGDRFNRTVESGEEEIQQPAPVMGAVPEPGFWVGTVVATGFFLLQRRRRVHR